MLSGDQLHKRSLSKDRFNFISTTWVKKVPSISALFFGGKNFNKLNIFLKNIFLNC